MEPADPPVFTAADSDLYCLQCGYNLRGLSGDPRRCPECGHLNPLGDLELPAEMITAQLKRMESAPVVCIAAILLLLPLGGLPTLITIEGVISGGQVNGITALFMCGAYSICTLMWSIHARRFRSYCAGAPGWLRALMMYHVYGLMAVAAVIAVFAVGMPGIFSQRVPVLTGSREVDDALLFAVALLGVAAAIWLFGGWVRRRMQAVIEPMQRETAVRLAHEILRRRLEQGAGRRTIYRGVPFSEN